MASPLARLPEERRGAGGMGRARAKGGGEGDEFYTRAEEYWAAVRPTEDGVLGGFAHLSGKDVRESEAFLLGNLPSVSGSDALHALDAGAGIGRVSCELLLEYFDAVDLEECLPHFLDEARRRVRARIAAGGFKRAPAGKRSVRFIDAPAQRFAPEAGRYDCIWLQWFVGHLPDEQLVRFLSDCRRALRPGGRIFVKENVIGEAGAPAYGAEDSSYTRSVENFRGVFEAAQLTVHSQEVQRAWPRELYGVRMFCLKGEDGG